MKPEWEKIIYTKKLIFSHLIITFEKKLSESLSYTVNLIYIIKIKEKQFFYFDMKFKNTQEKLKFCDVLCFENLGSVLVFGIHDR